MALIDDYPQSSAARNVTAPLAKVSPPTPEPKGPKPKAKGTFNRTVYQRDLMRVRRKQARAQGPKASARRARA